MNEFQWLDLLVVMILSGAAFFRSFLGFGDAVLAMPLLTLIVGLKTASPTIALVATTIAITILLKNWRLADLKATFHLIISSCFGIPLGILFLKQGEEPLMKSILGVILILYGLYRVLSPTDKKIGNSSHLSCLFGFIAGIMGGAFNTNGPPVVIYGNLRGWPPRLFRATLQGYFLPTGFFIALGHGVSGLWTPLVIRYYLLALPLVFLAIFLGGRLNSNLHQHRFDRLINLILIFMGCLLMWETFR